MLEIGFLLLVSKMANKLRLTCFNMHGFNNGTLALAEICVFRYYCCPGTLACSL